MKDNSTITPDELEIIERYIANQLTTQELKDINQLLELDDEFKGKVEDIKTIFDGIETQALKEHLDEFHKGIATPEVDNKPNKNRFLNFNKVAIAVAIIIALGGIWFFSTPQNEKLYAAYFKPASITTKLEINNDTIFNALKTYKKGNYKLAIKKWHTAVDDNADNDSVNYFIGIAHLANKNVDSAIPFLERTVQTEREFPLINEAYYYLGLAYLKEGNTELAKTYLGQSKTKLGKEILLKLDN